MRILLTGSTGYIGTELLKSLTEAKNSIIAITSREKAEINEFIQLYPQVSFLTIDEFSDQILNIEPIDGIIFSHGINQKSTVKNLSYEKARALIDVNFLYVTEIISHLLKSKKINKGASIVFISSISSIHYSVSNAAYSASKAALEAYANTLVLELSPLRIRVNTIRPGLLEGKMKDAYALDDSMNDFIQKIPLKRLGTAQDVANLTMFLLSEKSSWMTGSTIDLDGGIKFI